MMISIEHRIVPFELESEFPDVHTGPGGQLRIVINGKKFCDIYPPELDDIMGWDYLDIWFENFLSAVLYLQENIYIYVAYIESSFYCIRFCKKGKRLEIAEIYEKGHDPYHLDTSEKATGDVQWISEVPTSEVLTELFRAAKCYIADLAHWPGNEDLIRSLSAKLDAAKAYTSQNKLL